MKQRQLAIVSVVVLVLIIAGAVAYIALRPHNDVTAASTAPVAAQQLAVGSAAPEFTAATTNGYFDLAKTQKPVFAEFFATWCPHCQRETTVINALYAKYKDRVDFVAVPSDPRAMDHNTTESSADVLQFVQQFHVQYPVAIFDPDLTAAKLYLQGGYPTVVVIGADKKIAFLDDGEISKKDLEKAIGKALK